MLIDEYKNINSSTTELKKFGITIGIFVGILGLLLLYFNKSSYFYFIILSPIFIVPALVAPKLLLPFQKVWMGIAVTLGFVMSRVILTILFYVIITPLSLIAKVFGKDFLNRKIDFEKKSYWNFREEKEYEQIDTERQF